MQKIRTDNQGITFSISPVERASSALAQCRATAGIAELLREEFQRSGETRILSHSDYNSQVVRDVRFHPLINAVHLAFSLHHPLALSPDMIWVTICQGLAQHINNNAERLRDRIVSHHGKLTLVVQRNDIYLRSPETAWDEVIHDLSFLLREHIGEKYDKLISDFSTTGNIEITACEVALLDAFQSYFEYAVYCMCGIPEVTLEGTLSDWQHLRKKIEVLDEFEMEWWTPHLREICDHFEQAAKGAADSEYWQNMYKLTSAYGYDRMNGWILKLIPYVKSVYTGNFTQRNPLLDHADNEASLTSASLPCGLSQVPFTLHVDEKETWAMQFLGGFLGVEQHERTLALRPKLGWAVGQVGDTEQIILTVCSKGEAEPALDRNTFEDIARTLCENAHWSRIPAPFFSFYKKCNGIKFSRPSLPNFRKFQDCAMLHDPEEPRRSDDEIRILEPPYIVFADHADGRPYALHTGDGNVVLLPISASNDGRGRCAAPTAPEVVAAERVAESFLEFLQQTVRSLGS